MTPIPFAFCLLPSPPPLYATLGGWLHEIAWFYKTFTMVYLAPVETQNFASLPEQNRPRPRFDEDGAAEILASAIGYRGK